FSAGTSVLPIFSASADVTSRKGTQTSPRARKLLTSFAANSNSGDGTLASRFIRAAKCLSMKSISSSGLAMKNLVQVLHKLLRRTGEKYSVARFPWIDPAQKNVECAAEISLVVVIR